MRFCVVAFARRRHRPKEEEEEEEEDDGGVVLRVPKSLSAKTISSQSKSYKRESDTNTKGAFNPPSQSTHLGFLGFRRKKNKNKKKNSVGNAIKRKHDARCKKKSPPVVVDFFFFFFDSSSSSSSWSSASATCSVRLAGALAAAKREHRPPRRVSDLIICNCFFVWNLLLLHFLSAMMVSSLLSFVAF